MFILFTIAVFIIQREVYASTNQFYGEWKTVSLEPWPNHSAIHFYDKINPVWWFGNIDDPIAPPWYETNSCLRNVYWYMRNPMCNFCNYVIGVADKRTFRSGKYPRLISNPNGGWNFAYTRWKFIFLPFIDYKGHKGKFEFYFGWRERGNFGAKMVYLHNTNRPPATKR